MFELLLGLAVGLVLGWNFLPQPKWVTRLWEWLTY